MLGAAGFLSCVAAWRAALAASGGRVSLVRGTASLGVGSLVNTFAPARLGDVVKIALFSRAIDGPERVWTAGGVYAAVSAARCLSVAALVVAASATGALPLWPVFALCVGVAIVGAVALVDAVAPLPAPRPVAGFAELVRTPKLAARVLARRWLPRSAGRPSRRSPPRSAFTTSARGARHLPCARPRRRRAAHANVGSQAARSRSHSRAADRRLARARGRDRDPGARDGPGARGRDGRCALLRPAAEAGAPWMLRPAAIVVAVSASLGAVVLDLVAGPAATAGTRARRASRVPAAPSRPGPAERSADARRDDGDRIWPFRRSSMVAPKMMFVSSVAAPLTSAASLTS
jgi:hypothetical protein